MIPFEHAAPAVPHLLGYSFFLTKIGGYLFYKPNKEIAPPPSAAVVIPVFNEDPSLFTECLEQILNQSHPPEEIYVVDDASADTTCYDIASRKALAEPRLTVHRFDHNRGKRAIHQWVVQRSNADILVNVDSDVLIQTSGLHEALRPFSNERIQGVSTRATALNHDDNWLTRYLSNILISQDFDRAALSFFDSAYAAGRFSLFRIELFRRYENEYVNETFLGKPIRSGDDACMVRLALRHGRVIYQETSSARTLVANRIGTFVRQFLRWERNTLRTNLNICGELSMARPFWWFNNMDLATRLIFGPAFVVAAVLSPIITLKSFCIFYFVVLTLGFRRRSNLPSQKSAWLWLLATPAIKIIQAVIATPIRFYALATIRHDVWGSRKDSPSYG